MELTHEETVQACNKALDWLKQKYPVSKYTPLNVRYEDVPYLRGSEKVKASIIQDGLNFNIIVAAKRDVSLCIRAAFHEFGHYRQIAFDGIMRHEIKKKQEDAAWVFAINEMNEYVKEVGDNWRG